MKGLLTITTIQSRHKNDEVRIALSPWRLGSYVVTLTMTHEALGQALLGSGHSECEYTTYSQKEEVESDGK